MNRHSMQLETPRLQPRGLILVAVVLGVFLFGPFSMGPVSIGIELVQAQSVFPDKGLEAAIRQEVFAKRYNEEPITADDVKNISQVVGKGKNIQSLEGMQYCLAIALIDLENNAIQDLAPLKELKHLQSVNLAGNKIESIAPLSELTGLQYLELSRNRVKDLAPLQGMTNMRSLYLSENQVEVLAPLVEQKKLGTLYIAKNPIADFAPIGQLKWLHSLDAQGCKVKDLAFLKPLRQLNYLMLVDNELSNLDSLLEMCEGEKSELNRFAPFLQIYLENNPVQKEAGQLEKLKLYGVRIKSLAKSAGP